MHYNRAGNKWEGGDWLHENKYSSMARSELMLAADGANPGKETALIHK